MRICVITSGHLATCPRMVKAADAFAEAGHEVRLVSTQFMDWAAEADQEVGLKHAHAWAAIDYRRRTEPARYWQTGLRFHAARKWVRVVGPQRAGIATLAAANGRAARDLIELALAEPADLYYGGTSGGLAVTALAARRAGVPYGVDLEDFHEGELEYGPAWDHRRNLLHRLQAEVLRDASFVTAGSAAIAARYEKAYDVPVLPIHNTFSLPLHAPDPEPSTAGCLRLYWFSQTVGAGRGLEDVVRAIGLAGIRAELHLRGVAQAEYLAGLRRLASLKLAVQVHDPAPPDRMIELSLPYDAGLSPEEGRIVNRELCLGNKALTYILAGLAVVLTDTAGQRPLAEDLGEGALRYRPGDVVSLAQGLRRWVEDRGRLRRARQAAWQAARLRWNWDHRCEKWALLEAVEAAFR
jgi:glycosyltransferase involved in cell wall biosynthesis